MSNNAYESRKYTKYLGNELGHGGRGYRALLKLYKEFAAVLESGTVEFGYFLYHLTCQTFAAQGKFKNFWAKCIHSYSQRNVSVCVRYSHMPRLLIFYLQSARTSSRPWTCVMPVDGDD
jgi:hypothetical protein